MIRILAANSRNMPFIHFIEILLHRPVSRPVIGRVISESDYTNRFDEMHLNRDAMTMLMIEITP